MSTTSQKTITNTAPATSPTPTTNGTAPDAAKQERKPREVPTVVCSPTKEEYAEIQAAMTALMGGVKMNIAYGPFVLACALKEIRTNAKIQDAVKAAK